MLDRGVHVVSNDVMGESWPKTRRLKSIMEEFAGRMAGWESEGKGIGDMHEVGTALNGRVEAGTAVRGILSSGGAHQGRNDGHSTQ